MISKYRETYEYDHERLVQIVTFSARGGATELGYVDELQYDDDGRLLEVTRQHPDGSTSLVYQRARKGEPLKALAERRTTL